MAVKFAPPILNALRLALGKPEPSGQLALLWLMATACEQNLSLDAAVDALAADAKGQWKFRLTDFANLLRRGMPIEQAAQRVPNLLPPQATLALKVGSTTGSIGSALRSEAERMAEEQAELEGITVVGAVVYAGSILIVAASILAFLMLSIVPKYMKLAQDFDVELPAVTESMIDFCSGPGLYMLVPASLCLLAIPILWTARMLGFRLTIANPLQYFPRLDAGPILRQLGIAIESGKPVLDALKTISTEHPHTATWKRMSHVYECVKAGEKPWGMMHDRRIISSRERQLLESAERAGNLGWVLQLLGRHIESQQTFRAQATLRLVRPILIGLVGLFVAWIAIAMYMPLIKMTNDLA